MRTKADHFEPNEIDDPKVQRLLHAALENIDYTAYAANRRQVAESLKKIDIAQFEKLVQDIVERVQSNATPDEALCIL